MNTIDKTLPPPPGHGVTIDSAVDNLCGADGFIVINEGGDILDPTPRGEADAIRVAWLRVEAAELSVVRIALDGNKVHYWGWFNGEDDYANEELDADVANYAITKLGVPLELATVDPADTDSHSHYEILFDQPNGESCMTVNLTRI